QIEHKTLHQRTYEAVLRPIASGVLPTGAHFDEQMLSVRLGVSRTPVRSAIARRTQEGLVVRHDHINGLAWLGDNAVELHDAPAVVPLMSFDCQDRQSPPG
ncbi:MAG TPA: GntR family transcriptional regulator, partial [Chloroflexota bacterium]|nr:GntR family transcriptional regulator [Chloroflexota bacterium]